MKPIKLKQFCRENDIAYSWLYYQLVRNYYPVERISGGFNIKPEILQEIKKDYANRKPYNLTGNCKGV